MSRYEADPNNTLKMIPKAPSIDAHGKATVPSEETIVDRPNHILINVNGTYAFAYESGSISTYETGSVVNNAASGPVRLDINPVAWRQTDAAGTKGDVTFIYTGNIG